jgi:hypothetical protein
MTGLDPVIHAVPPTPMSGKRAFGTPWMPGSSPGLAMWCAKGYVVR